MDASSIKFGVGATREVGFEMKLAGAHRVMVGVDPNLVDSETVSLALQSLKNEGIDASCSISAHRAQRDLVQGSCWSLPPRASRRIRRHWRGSTMDTTKAANLYATHPADFFDYVNAPIGKGTPVPGPLMPMVAIPHHRRDPASETTGVAILRSARD